MTTAAMVIGVVPLLIADGAGAKSRFDIGVVIAAGMTIGTMFTLFITPAIYSYVARDRRGMAVAIASEVEAVPLPVNQNSKKKRQAPPPMQEAAESGILKSISSCPRLTRASSFWQGRR